MANVNWESPPGHLPSYSYTFQLALPSIPLSAQPKLVLGQRLQLWSVVEQIVPVEANKEKLVIRILAPKTKDTQRKNL